MQIITLELVNDLKRRCGMLVQLDTVSVKLEGPGCKSNFKVVGGRKMLLNWSVKS